jgi:ElaB/YqjD/DUF883 family membrane-anchored ribosome-binding protein
MEDPMTNQDIGSKTHGGASTGTGARSSTTEGVRKDIGKAASEAASYLSDTAQQAAEKAKQSASQAASSVTHQVKGVLDKQVASGAETVRHFANSVEKAAGDLEQDAPQLAGLVRGMATRLDDFAEDIQHQSADQLLRTASDFTRRQPALVFGLAALAGFFVFRTLKAAPAAASASSHHAGSSQYSGGGRYEGSRQFHGV